jgi:hypothetical protein
MFGIGTDIDPSYLDFAGRRIDLAISPKTKPTKSSKKISNLSSELFEIT